MFCSYYQAQAIKDRIWFITGILRNENHWAFDRALEGTPSTLEFFVAPDFEEEFCSLMNFFKKNGDILWIEKLPNRLAPFVKP